MRSAMEKIGAADRTEIQLLLQAVLQRYAVLYPQWEVSTFSIDRRENRIEQIDAMIRLLQAMKAAEP